MHLEWAFRRCRWNLWTRVEMQMSIKILDALTWFNLDLCSDESNNLDVLVFNQNHLLKSNSLENSSANGQWDGIGLRKWWCVTMTKCCQSFLSVKFNAFATCSSFNLVMCITNWPFLNHPHSCSIFQCL